MASTIQLLPLEEFRARYGDLKPPYEYWNGEPVQKPISTKLHGITQGLVWNLLIEAGYKASLEVELRIDPDWQPVPDVMALNDFELSYPTRPVDVVVEILSSDDRMSRVIEKCRRYSAIGIRQIVVIDPEHRYGSEWMPATQQLVMMDSLLLPNGKEIDLAKLWERLDQQLA